jgi:hypothetical protein
MKGILKCERLDGSRPPCRLTLHQKRTLRAGPGWSFSARREPCMPKPVTEQHGGAPFGAPPCCRLITCYLNLKLARCTPPSAVLTTSCRQLPDQAPSVFQTYW